MNKHFKWDKTYLFWGITAFCVIAAAILFYMALNYISLLGNAVNTLINILSPFIWGLVICYLLGPLVRSMQKTIFDPLAKRLYKKNKRNDGSGFARAMSVFCAEIIMLAVLAALVYLIMPQLYNSMYTIVSSSPVYIQNASDFISSLLEDYPEIEYYISSTIGDVGESFTEWMQMTVLPELGKLITNVGTGVYYVLRSIYNLVIGIIVSAYLLGRKEIYKANAKRMLYSILSVENARRFLDGLDFVDKTFIGFINGKLVDSAIIGFICYICCSLLRMPYTLLISVIIGVTNIIPFFGPFIGAIPCALIILLIDPVKFLIFVIFIIVLQQVDGNIIGPKVLGTTIGINGFWVMFSIVIGAGLFGFWGMLLGVPVFVVIYTLINSRVDKKLRSKDLPWATEDYVDLDYIDPRTMQTVRKTDNS